MRRARYYGGPYDGEYTDVIGPELRYPIKRELVAGALGPYEIPIECAYRVGVYKLALDCDGQYVYAHEGLRT